MSCSVEIQLKKRYLLILYLANVLIKTYFVYDDAMQLPKLEKNIHIVCFLCAFFLESTFI